MINGISRNLVDSLVDLQTVLTRNRYDFDGLGKRVIKLKIQIFWREDEDDNKGKGMLDKFLAGIMSYDPEKNKSETDEF